MKKLFIYGVTALAMLTGCNDLLDKSPLDTFTNTPAYWSNTDNLDNQCNTFITTLPALATEPVEDGSTSNNKR